MSTHLDLETWKALLEGRLDPAAREAVVRHLETGCETCDAFLADAAANGQVDALDGFVDDALLAVGPEPAAAADDLGFERIRRKARRPALVTRLAAGTVALAAAAAVIVLFVHTGPGPSPIHMKGVGGPVLPKVHLEVFRAGPAASPAPLPRGAVVRAGAVLAFRVRLDAPACVQLWRRDGAPTPLLPKAVCLPAGSHVLARGGAVLGFTADTPGPLDLYLVPEGATHGAGALRAKIRHGGDVAGADHFPLRVEKAPPEVQ